LGAADLAGAYGKFPAAGELTCGGGDGTAGANQNKNIPISTPSIFN